MGLDDGASSFRNMSIDETALPLAPSQSQQRQRGVGPKPPFTVLTADKPLPLYYIPKSALGLL